MSLLDTVEAVKKSFGVGNDNVVDKVINNVQTASDYAENPVALVDAVNAAVDAVNEAAGWGDYSTSYDYDQEPESYYEPNYQNEISREPEAKIAENLINKVKNTSAEAPVDQEDANRNTVENIVNNTRAAVDNIISNSPSAVQTQSTDTSPETVDVGTIANNILDPSVVVMNNDKAVDEREVERQRDNELTPNIDRDLSSAYNDPSRLDELRQEVADEQRRQLELAKQAEELKYIADHGAQWGGANPYDDLNFQSNLENIRSADTASPVAFDMQRRFFDSSGNLKTNPLDWDILGFSSQNKSSDAARQLYEYGFAHSTPTESPYVPAGNEVVDRRMIDDGYDPKSREGIYMTGEQYLKYRNEFGIPGRDVNDIIPDALYSKQNEMNEFGFIPYIVSGEGVDSFHNEASAQALNQAYNDFSNLRRNNTDFDVNLDGNKYSGNDFIKSFNEQGKNLQAQMQDNNNYMLTKDPAMANALSLPIDGVINKRTGEVKNGFTIDDMAYDDDAKQAMFPDGTVWHYDNLADINDHFSEDGSNAIAWYTPDPSKFDSVTLSDGSVIDGVNAMNIMTQIYEGKGDNIDYGDYNWGKQNPGLPEDLLDLNQWGDFFSSGEYAPWFADMVLGSLPFFDLRTGVPRGVSRAATTLHGISPDRNDINGTYSLLEDNMKNNQAIAQSIGAAGMPFMEHLWGPVGGRALGAVFPKYLSDQVVKTWNPVKRIVSDAIGEGLEEVPGNIFENLERQGTDWYMPTVPGEYEEKSGRPIYVQKPFMESIPERVSNFIQDAPEAIISGATLGGVFGLANTPGYIGQYANYKNQLKKFGDHLEEPGENGRRLTEEEIARYNR